MASERDQLQAEIRRLENDVRSAKDQTDLHKSRITSERDAGKKAILRGTLAGAENMLRNAERSLDNARSRLRGMA